MVPQQPYQSGMGHAELRPASTEIYGMWTAVEESCNYTVDLMVSG